jgi:hypothetical protein
MMTAMIPMKREMLLWMSEGKMKNGVDAYFFRAVKSDCNGYMLLGIDTIHPMLL